MGDRNLRSEVVAAALDIGVDAEIKDGAIVLNGKPWSAIFKDAGMADVFMTGYRHGLADRLIAEQETLRSLTDFLRSDQPVKPPEYDT